MVNAARRHGLGGGIDNRIGHRCPPKLRSGLRYSGKSEQRASAQGTLGPRARLASNARASRSSRRISSSASLVSGFIGRRRERRRPPPPPRTRRKTPRPPSAAPPPPPAAPPHL